MYIIMTSMSAGDMKIKFEEPSDVLSMLSAVIVFLDYYCRNHILVNGQQPLVKFGKSNSRIRHHPGAFHQIVSLKRSLYAKWMLHRKIVSWTCGSDNTVLNFRDFVGQRLINKMKFISNIQ